MELIYIIGAIVCLALSGAYVIKRFKGLSDEQQEKKKR